MKTSGRIIYLLLRRSNECEKKSSCTFLILVGLLWRHTASFHYKITISSLLLFATFTHALLKPTLSPSGPAPVVPWLCCSCWEPPGLLECCTSSKRLPSPRICSPSPTPSRGCSSSSSSASCPER